jgi:hypothetical protein
MRVTAPSKMGKYVHAAASYGGQLVETRYFLTKPLSSATTRIAINAAAVQSLLNAAGQAPAKLDGTTAAGRVLWRGVPVAAVQSFIKGYTFDERSTDISSDLMRDYIDRRNKKGALLSWNVGVVGNAPSADAAEVQLPGGVSVAPVRRTRLETSGKDAVADIKTLTGSRDAALDLTPPSSKALSRTELNKLRRQQQADKGLLLLYPINPRSGEEEGDVLKDGRVPLGAPGDEVVWGVAFVFPEPRMGDDSIVEYNYVQADLTKVFPASVEDFESEAEEAAILTEDQDAEAPAA